jgi:hypothetical protein
MKMILEITQLYKVCFEKGKSSSVSLFEDRERKKPIPIESTLNTKSIQDIVNTSSGLSFGIGTFISPQSSNFVKNARKRKKKPRYPQNER